MALSYPFQQVQRFFSRRCRRQLGMAADGAATLAPVHPIAQNKRDHAGRRNPRPESRNFGIPCNMVALFWGGEFRNSLLNDPPFHSATESPLCHHFLRTYDTELSISVR